MATKKFMSYRGTHSTPYRLTQHATQGYTARHEEPHEVPC